MLLLLLSACGTTLEAQVDHANLTRVGGGLHMELVMGGSECRPVASLRESTLGGMPVDYVSDEQGFNEATGEVSVSEYGVWADTGGCLGSVRFGWQDTSSLSGEESVTLNIVGEAKEYEVVLLDFPMQERSLEPEGTLDGDTLPGSEMAFGFSGPGELRRHTEVGVTGADGWLYYLEEEGQVTVADDRLIVRFPEASEIDGGAITSVEFVNYWDDDFAPPYSDSDAIGTTDFYIQDYTSHGARFVVTP